MVVVVVVVVVVDVVVDVVVLYVAVPSRSTLRQSSIQLEPVRSILSENLCQLPCVTTKRAGVTVGGSTRLRNEDR